jgi:hypothetical protein
MTLAMRLSRAAPAVSMLYPARSFVAQVRTTGCGNLSPLVLVIGSPITDLDLGGQRQYGNGRKSLIHPIRRC